MPNNMSRACALKSGYFPLRLIGVLMAMIIMLAAQPAAATPPVFTIVYPTGVFPDDINNVQAAVDKGGTVFLRAVNAAGVATAFNFGTAGPHVGESGAVSLSTDVAIVGERTASFGATINGGFAPFQCFVPVKSMIRGIDFESPFDEAIAIIASTGSEISENSVHNVVPVKVRVPSGRIITFAEGIGFGGTVGSPQLVSGRVRIADNVVQNANAIFANGIQIDSASADIEIVRNSFETISSNGIAVVRTTGSVSIRENTVLMSLPFGTGILSYQAHGSVVIRDNRVVTSSPTSSGGILINGDRDAVYKVVDNTVVCDGIFPDGIAVAGGDATSTDGVVGAVVRHNHVTMHNSIFGGVSLYDLVTDSHVEDNEIDGDAAYALQVSTIGPPTNIASLNRFIDNDIENFASSVADVFLDANSENNVVFGECKSVLDLGTGNSVICSDAGAQKAAGSTNAATHTLAVLAASAARARKQQAVQMFSVFHGLGAKVSTRQE